MSKRILTGITTTGTPHIGNYLGAIKPALNLSKEFDESYFFLADYHAIIKNSNSSEIKDSVKSVAQAWLASGLDPEKSNFYRQSDVPEILELSWILNCVTAKGLMNRSHAYKAATALNEVALLAEALKEEIPDTLAAVRVSGLELTDALEEVGGVMSNCKRYAHPAEANWRLGSASDKPFQMFSG